MKIFNKFIIYYLPWLVGMSIVFGLRILVAIFLENKKQNATNPRILILTISIVILLTIFCGGIYHIFFELYRPWRIKKLFKRIKYLDLSEIGLSYDNELDIISGFYKGYYLTLNTDTRINDGDYVIISIYILATENDVEKLKKLEQKHEINSTFDNLLYVSCKTKFRFFRNPKPETIINNLIELIDTLRFDSIHPLKISE